MNPKHTSRVVVQGEAFARLLAAEFVAQSASFTLDPLPDDEWEFLFKSEQLAHVNRFIQLFSPKEKPTWRVIVISGSSGGVTRRAEVNLRVIADGMKIDDVENLTCAAPALLAALERALSLILSQGLDGDEADQCRAAIAAAKGTDS
jgi:hypothetical protein